jgi:CoA:oxalate CoA-transferase
MKDSPFTQQLQGVRVLDISRVLAGPHCTAMLADLGADVIKFEVPMHGDDSRHLGPFRDGESVYFGLINRGKRSVEIDFKSTSDRARFYQLVADADVVVENFRPGVTQRLGIDFETLKQHNPRLIYASISGFGQEGPLSRRPAYDIVAQAMSGLMSVTGFAETGPTRSGEAMGDLCAGVYAAWAISSALFARERHAPGAQYIDVAMFDVLFSLQMTGLSNLYANGVAPGLVGNRHPVSTPFDTYRAADGLVVIAVASNKLFQRLCECMGKVELASDPRFIDVTSLPCAAKSKAGRSTARSRRFVMPCSTPAFQHRRCGIWPRRQVASRHACGNCRFTPKALRYRWFHSRYFSMDRNPTPPRLRLGWVQITRHLD